MLHQFGGKANATYKNTYAKSSNWKEGKFMNLEETKMEFSFRNMPELLKKQFFEREDREPKQKIPIIPFQKDSFSSASERAKFIWYGHSVVLMKLNGKTILIDPMLGPNAAPIAPFPVKRFSDHTLALIDEFPEIDLLLMTHDHYDHLDYASIKKLKPKVKHYFAALGVGRHLEKWGIDKAKITEFDWWDQEVFEEIQITFTPTRHFSGRGLTDRAQGLWGGWTFKTATESIYFSGDGGYGNHFKEVGERLGPFDFGFMECGQYNKNWHQIHMYPEESIQAGMDAKAQLIMPVHWAGFALALHTWYDPVNRFVAEAEKRNVSLMTPRIGEMIALDGEIRLDKWW